MKIFAAGTKSIKSLSPSVQKKLSSIISNGDQILVGDCNGADAAIQSYCLKSAFPNVTVYASGNHVRNNLGNWAVKNIIPEKPVYGFEFYRQKDLAMADDADCGFMIWDGKSRGTYSNIVALAKQNKRVLVYVEPSAAFYAISGYSGVEKLLRVIN